MVKVGGEVDAFCTKCQLTLAHTVHAMVSERPVKVECNTCHAVHRYKGPIGAAKAAAKAAHGRPASARANGTARERPAAVSFEELLGGRNVAAAQPYSPKKTFAMDEVVDHPMFGRGFVSGVRDGKVEITFRSDVKILVHGRG
ncbi:hypothetical protein [Anaeromyxobacter oryzisoli]|uniref:hypothetical protein n=1 Tax=Anaeromyxobacter oryzisoli TaxID=2925408 RepID=UPI001F58E3D5|nr:hypothetical protein [Anaeromyxobacter sp. SG63]